MSRTLVIERWHPATVNELMSSIGAKIRLKKIDRNMVCGYVALHRFPPATGKRQVRLTIVSGDSDPGRPADPDARWKSLLDALVWARQLVDDSSDWCEPVFVANERGPVKSTIIELIDL